MNQIVSIITFDIEEWALAKAGGYGTNEKYAEYDSYLDRILSTLDRTKIKATFFCTGMMAHDFPQVVKLIDSRGHEVGCHSFSHTWMNKLTKTAAKMDTYRAVDEIEQCIGKKVLSYRAPAFSIGENNKWMFEILADNGIIRDASVFPAVRDFGGFPSFVSKTPCIISYNGIRIKEFPICTVSIAGKDLAYSGGGYFRFFPLSFVKKQIEGADYSMCYFHINDLLTDVEGVLSKERYEAYFKEPGTIKNRYLRYFKTNLGKKRAWTKLESLLVSNPFLNLASADSLYSWDDALLISL